MKLSCPACGAQYDVDAALSDADGRRLMEMQTHLPGATARALLRYLTLFRPAKNRMSWSRAYSLAGEIVPLIRAGRVVRNGTTYAVPAEAWASAMQALAERPARLTLPLKSHGYLLEMLAGSAEQAAAKEEARREQARTRRVPAADSVPHKTTSRPSTHDTSAPPTDRATARRNLQRIQGLINPALHIPDA